MADMKRARGDASQVVHPSTGPVEQWLYQAIRTAKIGTKV